jgi:hypothetical protein
MITANLISSAQFDRGLCDITIPSEMGTTVETNTIEWKLISMVYQLSLGSVDVGGSKGGKAERPILILV